MLHSQPERVKLSPFVEVYPFTVRELALWPVQTITEGRPLGGEREETWVQGMAPQSLTMGLDESFSCRVSAFSSVQ